MLEKKVYSLLVYGAANVEEHMIPSVKNYNADTFPPVFVIASTVSLTSFL